LKVVHGEDEGVIFVEFVVGACRSDSVFELCECGKGDILIDFCALNDGDEYGDVPCVGE
jgi:hypothetical protein